MPKYGESWICYDHEGSAEERGQGEGNRHGPTCPNKSSNE